MLRREGEEDFLRDSRLIPLLQAPVLLNQQPPFHKQPTPTHIIQCDHYLLFTTQPCQELCIKNEPLFSTKLLRATCVRKWGQLTVQHYRQLGRPPMAQLQGGHKVRTALTTVHRFCPQGGYEISQNPPLCPDLKQSHGGQMHRVLPPEMPLWCWSPVGLNVFITWKNGGRSP